jgi:hypothetical protein
MEKGSFLNWKHHRTFRRPRKKSFPIKTSATEQIAEELGFRRTAPKGASQFEELTASLKRMP